MRKFAIGVLGFAVFLFGCESFERRAARELLRLRKAHEALLEEAADQYLDLQARGKGAEAERFREAVLALDGKLRTIEREAAELLFSYLSMRGDDDRLRLEEKLALLMELVSALAQTVRRGS